VTLLVADLIWVWAKTAIDRRMADFGDLVSAGGEGGGSAGPEARMATLLPILRKILLITIIVIVSLSISSSMGINIGPILAGGNCSPPCQLHWYEHRISCQACANGSESAKTAQIAGCDD
jgi:hypothetical protein